MAKVVSERPQFIVCYVAIVIVINNDQKGRQEKGFWSTELKSHLSAIFKNCFYFILIGFINLAI